MQFVPVIYDGSEMSVSEEEKKAAYADYAALNNMENVTGCPRWVCRRTRQLFAWRTARPSPPRGRTLTSRVRWVVLLLSRPRTSMPRSP
jgi:hypothetical protein